MSSIFIADIDDSDNPIFYAFTEQTTQETPSLLVGGLPKYDEKGKLKQEMILVVCVSTPFYPDFCLTSISHLT